MFFIKFYNKGVRQMKKYRKISARKFLDTLPYWLRKGYNQTHFSLYISNNLLKKIVKEMSKGGSITNVYIHAQGYTLLTEVDNNPMGLYLAPSGNFQEVLMCVVSHPISKTKTLTLCSRDKVKKGDCVYFF